MCPYDNTDHLQERVVPRMRVMALLGLDFYYENLQSLVKNLYFHTFESPKYPRCPKFHLGAAPSSFYSPFSDLHSIARESQFL